MKIDAHHHFWKYTEAEYGWIADKMRDLRRDFLPEDLERIVNNARIDAVVSVQARQSLEETRWLLKLASRHDFIQGVVGWAPLTLPNAREILENLRENPKLKAVRHVLQDEPDDDYMLGTGFNQGIRELTDIDLTFDILIHERHLPQALRFVDRHPEQVFVLNHIAKPKIRDHELEPWRGLMMDLAERENVCCKISGMVTEADWENWTQDDLKPYLDTVFEAFGPQRLLFGSDWPVCTIAGSYEQVVSIVADYMSGLSPDEQAAVWGGNARKAYRLGE